MLHYCHMGHTLTIRLTAELASWLEETSSRTGVPQGQIVREQLERAKVSRAKGFMRLAGSIKGAQDLSSRKGFSKA